MHGMMGSSQMKGGGHGAGQAGQKGHGSGPMGKGAADSGLQHMQNRKDMMQGMMEQMQKQHKLMLRHDDKK